MPKSESIREPLAPGVWKIIGVVVLGPLLSNLDATVVNVSLSTLGRELGASIATIQWVISGYLLALALMLPLTGWLVDRMGAKRVYLICFSAFTLASMLCGLSWSTSSLIGFRVLQGMAGGLLAPMAQMMMARVAGRQMARVMGYASFPILLGPILGPVLAGMILQHASWRWLFYINLPIGILAVVLALVFLPEDREETKRRPFDFYGFLLLSPGLVLLLYGVDHVSATMGRILLGMGAAMLLWFVAYARRLHTSALIDLRLFRSRYFSFAAITQFLTNGVMFAGQMLIPLYLMLGCGLSPAYAGALLAPLGIGMLCFTPFAGAVTERFGFRPVAATGAMLALLGTLPFAYMAGHGLSIPITVVALFLRGAALGSIMIASMSGAYASIPRDELPMATTALNIVQRFGGPMLTTIVSVFLAWKMKTVAASPASHPAFAQAFWLLAIFHGACLVTTAGLPTFLKRQAAPVSEIVLQAAE